MYTFKLFFLFFKYFYPKVFFFFFFKSTFWLLIYFIPPSNILNMDSNLFSNQPLCWKSSIILLKKLYFNLFWKKKKQIILLEDLVFNLFTKIWFYDIFMIWIVLKKKQDGTTSQRVSKLCWVKWWFLLQRGTHFEPCQRAY